MYGAPDYCRTSLDCPVTRQQRFNKADQGQALVEEYARLGKPMDKCELVDLVRLTEVELSKNHSFKVVNLRALSVVWLLVGCSHAKSHSHSSYC